MMRNSESSEAKSLGALKAAVGTEPCVQCGEAMRSFCAKKNLSCDAFIHYEETGQTPYKSPEGWVV